MKSRVSPLALCGVLALCVAVLALAWWTFTSPAPRPLAEPDTAPLHDGAAHERLDPASASRALQDDTDGSRVALPKDEHQLSLPQAEYELRVAGERPLVGARTLLRRGEELLGSKRSSDADGIARFDAGEGHAELIVVPRDFAAFTRDVPLSAGKHLIELERGTAVAGHVRVAHEGAATGIELALVSDRPLLDDSQWPESVRHELDLGDRDKLRLATRTDASGHFEFSGLVAPWSGRLEVGDTHEIVAVSGGVWSPGADSVRLDDPSENIVLDLAALDLARGRVVASHGGPGVAGASVSGFLAFDPLAGEEDGMAGSFEGHAGEDGSFALPIHRRGRFDPAGSWPPLRSATLTLDGGGDIPRRRLELTGAQLPEHFDFGELILERGATLAFVALDAQSQPLAGAIGRLDGERSEPTDESGRSSIVYAPGTGRPLGVSLAGYRDARVDVPKEVPEVLQVVLERTNRLTVDVHNPDGGPAVGILVQIGGPRPVGPRNRRGRVNAQRTDGRGRAEFSDMAPATPLALTVCDAMGASVAEQSVTLGPDEWSSLEITLPRALLAFGGIVRDELGLSLAEASLEFTDTQQQNRGNVSAQSDAGGRFEFSGLSSPTGLLRVRKAGFAPLSLPDFQIPPPGVLADIRLERGLRLALRIVDARGAPVHGDNLRLEQQGERPTQGRRVADNEWEFANLPRTTLTAVATAGGREYRREVEPLNGNQDFVVPNQGGLELTLRLQPPLLGASIRITLRARDDRRVNPSQVFTGEALQTRTFGPLLPGEYQLNVMRFVQNEQRGEWVALGSVQKVTIAEGANQRLEIER